MKNLVLFACVFSALSLSAAASFADTKIGIIDTRKIVSDSEAGKSLGTQLKTRQDKLQQEANDLAKKLKAEQQDIESKRKDMKPEEYQAKENALKAELEKSRQDLYTKSLDLDTLRKTALAALQKYLAQASADVADEKKIQLILDRQFVVLAQQGMDVTTEVMTKLNAAVKIIPLDSKK